MRKKILFKIFLVFVYSFSFNLVAEIGSAAQAGGIAGNTEFIDRNDNAGQAASKGSAGQVMADLTGAALTARGIPMLSSPFPSVVATGVALLAMAAKEFAQGAVDNRSNDAQRSQQGVLTYDENQPRQFGAGGTTSGGADGGGGTGSGSSRVEGIVSQITTPEFSAAIESLGGNPAEIAQKIALGEIQDESQVAKALGVNPASDDPAASEALKNQVLGEVFGKAIGEKSFEKVETKDNADRGVASTVRNGGTIGDGGSDEASKKSLLSNLLPFGGSGDKDDQLNKAGLGGNGGLLSAGIQRGSRLVNIFQKAAMNFKKYGQKHTSSSVGRRSVKSKSRS